MEKYCINLLNECSSLFKRNNHKTWILMSGISKICSVFPQALGKFSGYVLLLFFFWLCILLLERIDFMETGSPLYQFIVTELPLIASPPSLPLAGHHWNPLILSSPFAYFLIIKLISIQLCVLVEQWLSSTRPRDYEACEN